MTSHEGKPALGIDLGGTKICAGVVTPSGDALSEARAATEADKDTDAVVGNIVRAARRAMDDANVGPADLRGAGLGSPAPLDLANGVILDTGNLPSLHNCPIVSRLSDALGCEVVMNNDANCFGLAEARFGAGADTDVCAGFTLGTGIGCFLVIGGRLFDGPRGAAAEIWCSPYQGDHVEEKTCGRSVARNYKKLTEKVATAKEIAERARSGDEAAREAWREYGTDLAVPIAYVANIVDPDVIVLGGSLAKAWDLFEEPMFHRAMKYINRVTREELRIVPAALGTNAGMLGAAALLF